MDPNKLCATGPSAGGSLSLLLATTGRDGDPNAKDPVERTSSRLQAVACLIGPTDYLNYGSQGVNALGVGPLSFAKGPFDFVRFNEKLRIYEKVTDEDEIREIGKAISPLYHITADDPPALFVHGTADRIVPLQQAQIAVERLKEVGVEAELNAIEGRGHSVGTFTPSAPPKWARTTAPWSTRAYACAASSVYASPTPRLCPASPPATPTRPQ